MSNLDQSSLQEVTWFLNGKVISDTVNSLLHEGGARIKQARNGLAIDLSNVQACDSAGVALCIELLRMARAQNKQLLFCNPPVRMMDMIRVSGVDSILPLKNI
jgi:anti-anti-sigma factor